MSLSVGPTILAQSPLVAQMGFNLRLNDYLSSYSHELGVDGGYKRASLSMNLPLPEVMNWYADGLLRHIVTYNEAGVVIFEGFVNTVQVSAGSLQATIGPVLAIDNRVWVNYTTKSYSFVGGVTVGGEAKSTDVANDTTSQTRYGILARRVDGGEWDEASGEAEQTRDTWIADHKDPETDETVTLAGGGPPTVSLEILGYRDLFDRYYYANSADDDQNLSDKLAAILNASPNSYFVSTNASITANTLQVATYEDGQASAMSLIKDLVARGDSSDNRYLWRVEAGRKFIYEAVPTEYEYEHVLTRDGPMVRRFRGGAEVKPWNVLPGKWVFLSDFLIGKTQAATIRAESRALFIESLTYTAPYGLTMTGSKVTKIEQLLARFGLGGS